MHSSTDGHELRCLVAKTGSDSARKLRGCDASSVLHCGRFATDLKGTTPRHSISTRGTLGHESVINCVGSSPSVRWRWVLFRGTRVWGQRDRLDSVDLPDRFFDGRVSKTVMVGSLPFGGADASVLSPPPKE
jgi:hypothetical protein